MCLRFVFPLVTRIAAWLRLSRREDAWRIAGILILRHQLAVLQLQARKPKIIPPPARPGPALPPPNAGPDRPCSARHLPR
jgi:hypothetical protein